MDRDFSLGDLLAAVVCVALLAALVYREPGFRFGHRRVEARKSSCLSNQHHIGLAQQMYLNDSKGVWPQAVTSAECLALLHPEYAETPLIFSCPGCPTQPEEVDGKIINAGYLQDIAIPSDADPMRAVLGCKRGNHGVGSCLSFVDSHCEYVREQDDVLPNPYHAQEDTDVYTDQPDVDSTIDCDLSSGDAPDG